MTPAIKGVMLALSSSLAVSIVAKVTVIAALALFAAWLARGSRAAVRHALLASVFGVMLLPITSIVAPPVHLAVPIAPESRTALPPVIDAAPSVVTDAGVPAMPTTPQTWTLSPSVLLLAGWIAGGAIFYCRW